MSIWGTGLIRLCIGIIGELLWMRHWTSGFHKSFRKMLLINDLKTAQPLNVSKNKHQMKFIYWHCHNYFYCINKFIFTGLIKLKFIADWLGNFCNRAIKWVSLFEREMVLEDSGQSACIGAAGSSLINILFSSVCERWTDINSFHFAAQINFAPVIVHCSLYRFVIEQTVAREIYVVIFL